MGTVLAQNPQAGQRFAVGQDVELTISGGSTLVPEVIGVTPDKALTQLQENSLTMANIVYVETTDASQIGLVMAQDPAAGTLAVVDAPVTLTVAKASNPYSATVSVQPSASDKDRRIRVTLMENGKEETKLEDTLKAGTDAALLLPFTSALSGEMTCRVYIDDELFLEQLVTLQ